MLIHLLHISIMLNLEPPNNTLISLYRGLNPGSDKFGNSEQIIPNLRFAHNGSYLDDQIGSECFREQMLQICEIVVHVHFC